MNISWTSPGGLSHYPHCAPTGDLISGDDLNVFSAVNKAPPAPASWHINVCDWSQKAGAGELPWVSVNFILFLILDPSATFCFLLQTPF